MEVGASATDDRGERDEGNGSDINDDQKEDTGGATSGADVKSPAVGDSETVDIPAAGDGGAPIENKDDEEGEPILSAVSKHLGNKLVSNEQKLNQLEKILKLNKGKKC